MSVQHEFCCVFGVWFMNSWSNKPTGLGVGHLCDSHVCMYSHWGLSSSKATKAADFCHVAPNWSGNKTCCLAIEVRIVRRHQKRTFLFVFSWYPPGHGDTYESFYNSGLLKQFIDEGKEFLFVSNIDNLGATVDISILGHHQCCFTDPVFLALNPNVVSCQLAQIQCI